MFVSQKCQYALRAVFELAKCYGKGPVKIAEVAKAQAIPPRFLEVILNEMKQANFIESRRGNEGGYLMARDPRNLTIGEVIRLIQGPVTAVGCTGGNTSCRLYGECVFLPMWKKVERSISEVYDETTFQDLVDQEREKNRGMPHMYSI